jgi:asparagine N-glycosylation enzyme membrane subunit Stt3
MLPGSSPRAERDRPGPRRIARRFRRLHAPEQGAALHDGGAWFDPREPRVNPPAGQFQHWTRALDALLLAGAWLLEPLLGFARALHVWGVLISPVLLALAVLATAWAAAPALERDTRLLACLVLLSQPSVLAYTSIGRPDHHSLLLLLAVILTGLTARLAATPHDRWAALLAGALAGLAIWVSPEAMTFVAISLATLWFG